VLSQDYIFLAHLNILVRFCGLKLGLSSLLNDCTTARKQLMRRLLGKGAKGVSEDGIQAVATEMLCCWSAAVFLKAWG